MLTSLRVFFIMYDIVKTKPVDCHIFYQYLKHIKKTKTILRIFLFDLPAKMTALGYIAAEEKERKELQHHKLPSANDS